MSFVNIPDNTGSGGGGGGSGTVTSVAVAAPSIFTVTGSPVTTSGIIILDLASQSANTVFSGPTSGASAAPTFRQLVVNDIPTLPLGTKVSGILATTNGGIGISSTATFPASGVVAVVPSSGLVRSSGSALTTGQANLATEVTGVLPIANGGTNSSTALNNNRVMISSGSKIVESSAITASRALVSDTNGLPSASSVTSTELGFVSGVTSSIQTQLNGKQSSLGFTPVNKAGDTMLGTLVLSGSPTSSLEAATKSYVDSIFAAQAYGNLEGGTPSSVYGGTAAINGGTP